MRDHPAFAHTRLCSDANPATGGWYAAAMRLRASLNLPSWKPPHDASITELKRSLASYRKEVVLPAVVAASGYCPGNPPLPWAWLALHGDSMFPMSAFMLWWQLRVLGQLYPQDVCPWCWPRPGLSRDHLQHECPTFRRQCMSSGVNPEDAFSYPTGPDFFTAVLLVTHYLDTCRASSRTATP